MKTEYAILIEVYPENDTTQIEIKGFKKTGDVEEPMTKREVFHHFHEAFRSITMNLIDENESCSVN